MSQSYMQFYLMSSDTLHCFYLSFTPIALNCFENDVHVTSQKITFQNGVWSLRNGYKKEPDYEAILTSVNLEATERKMNLE